MGPHLCLLACEAYKVDLHLPQTIVIGVINCKSSINYWLEITYMYIYIYVWIVDSINHTCWNCIHHYLVMKYSCHKHPQGQPCDWRYLHRLSCLVPNCAGDVLSRGVVGVVTPSLSGGFHKCGYHKMGGLKGKSDENGWFRGNVIKTIRNPPPKSFPNWWLMALF